MPGAAALVGNAAVQAAAREAVAEAAELVASGGPLVGARWGSVAAHETCGM